MYMHIYIYILYAYMYIHIIHYLCVRLRTATFSFGSTLSTTVATRYDVSTSRVQLLLYWLLYTLISAQFDSL